VASRSVYRGLKCALFLGLIYGRGSTEKNPTCLSRGLCPYVLLRRQRPANFTQMHTASRPPSAGHKASRVHRKTKQLPKTLGRQAPRSGQAHVLKSGRSPRKALSVTREGGAFASESRGWPSEPVPKKTLRGPGPPPSATGRAEGPPSGARSSRARRQYRFTRIPVLHARLHSKRKITMGRTADIRGTIPWSRGCDD